MASGLGAGIAVMALPLADIGESSWRLVYLVTLIWLVVAVDISRRLPETVPLRAAARRRAAARSAPLRHAGDGRRLRQLLRGPGELLPEPLPPRGPRLRRRDDRAVHAHHRHPGRARPGRRRPARRRARPAPPDRRDDPDRHGADRALVHGRRGADVVAAPSAAGSSAASPTRRSPSIGPSCSPPATAAGRPGCSRHAALLGGVVGILLVGHLVDGGARYGSVIALVALGQLVVVAVVLTCFPETAHQELEALNPEDAIALDATSPAGRSVIEP